MKVLPVRFSDVAHLNVDDLSEATNASFSDVSRAALYLGLQQIKVLAAADVEKAQELIAISNLRAK